MTTISEAIKVFGQAGDYTIKGQLVTRQIFFTRRNGQLAKLLIEVIADQNGDLIEAKTWSERKVYTVFRKFEPNSYVELSGSAQFREPNRRYSQVKCDIYARWFLSPIDEFKFKTSVRCFSQIAAFKRSNKKPANVVGLFQAPLVMGPARKNARGHILVQGYYLRLIDEHCQLFQVLIWINENFERTNRCFDQRFEQDDLVMILCAREQEEIYRNNTPGWYTLTSTYPAAVAPSCISPQVYLALEEVKQSKRFKVVQRYDPENGSG